MVTSNPIFTIITLSNDLLQYRAMRDSFLAAGFDESRCEFRLLDNTAGNAHDPYAVLSSASTTYAGRFLIVCHQDVRIDRGAGYEDLLDRLEALTAMDPDWAVAGNFGITAELSPTGRVFDPNGTSFPGPFPRSVVSLDENFLVLRQGVALACSPGLGGFHLYGTDVCLSALHAGRRCYVIDFDLSHLSGGNPSEAAFRRAAEQLTAAWHSRFVCAVVGTPNTTLSMSRWAPVRALLLSSKVRRLVVRFGINLIAYPGWRPLPDRDAVGTKVPEKQR